MKKVLLKYNPFTIETEIMIDNEPISMDGELYSYRENRLQEWLDNLFPALAEECNDDIELKFRGTELDYEDVVIAKRAYEESDEANKIEIELSNDTFAESAEKRLEKLIDLFGSMQKKCPFPDLQTEDLKHSFKRAIESKLEVGVIATMSSGKSTLINSLLGSNLMPSKHAACTAKIARIKDIDGKVGFSAECRNKTGKTVKSDNNITADVMKKYNDDENIVEIDIEGDIPFASSKKMQLILMDTPGPNNARVEEHSNRTERVIKSNDMPMVLYVMNATQQFTNDDDRLFSMVAKAMRKQHGKQARDRFIFIINKMDEYNIFNDGPVDGTVRKYLEYLKDKGIENANIYPVSAEIAKLIRLKKNNIPLDLNQDIMLDCGMKKMSIEGMQLNEYAPLSISGKKALDEEIKRAKSNEMKEEEILVYTGVPAIEIAINEYLEKYAVSSKIHEAVDVFKRRIDEKQYMAEITEKMSTDVKKRHEIKSLMTKLKQQLDDGKKAQELRDKIDGLDVEKLFKEKSREIGAEFVKKLEVLQGKRDVDIPIDKAKSFIDDLDKKSNELLVDLNTDLELLIDESIIKNSKLLLREYNQHIKILLEDTHLLANTYDFDVSLDIMTAHIPSGSRLINEYKEKRNRKVEVGEKWVWDAKLLNPFTWLDFHKEKKYKDQEYEVVKGRKIVEEYVAAINRCFRDNINNANDEAKNQADDFKNYFVNELIKLDSVVKKKTNEWLDKSSDDKKLKEALKKNNENKKWLSNFQNKLDEVISV